MIQFRCRFSKLCLPISSFLNVNPNSQIIIDGKCNDGCYWDDIIEFKYKFYFTYQKNSSSNELAWIYFNKTDLFTLGKYIFRKKYKNALT